MSISEVENVIVKPEIDFLFLADFARVVEGSLYVMGGAWDKKTVTSILQPVQIVFAAAILVPWSQADLTMGFTFQIQGTDGTEVEKPMTGGFKVHRTPNTEIGQALRALIAAQANVKLPSAGSYRLRLVLEGGDEKIVRFHIAERSPARGA